ncbi:hypothetical protein AB0G32_08830 [Streptomyces sp. NPDC023723]|uniref:hypothetical protein n=1 Tax=Streptomyces sp. NPDC023723 TaxID=3154323 RepID=UPI0033D8C04E
MTDHGPDTPDPRTASTSGSVSIGSMSGGSVATGAHASATSYHTTGAAPDARHAELLDAIRELRAALPSAADRTDADTSLDRELADTAAEIAHTGAAAPARLTRLLGGVRGWLGGQAAAAGAVASATAVVQGIAQLIN